MKFLFLLCSFCAFTSVFAFPVQSGNIGVLNPKDMDFNNVDFVLSKKRTTPKSVQQTAQVVYKYLPVYYPVKVPVYYPVYIPKYIPVESLKNIR